jgi:arabinofuranan 3-O-arabinosyltransferase
MIEAPERATGGAVPPAQVVDERVRSRIRLLAFSLLLVVLPFVTAPGRIIADTKLDLAVNPAAFLAHALTLWNPQEFGLLQQQAAGYLFPMGPFFWLGRLAALEPWVIQRLWIGVVAVVAFLGMVRLAGRLGIGTPWTRVAAGFAYAASPAGLPVIGALSNEFLPAAMLPWILLPLVDAGRGGRRGIAAARSAAAVGLCGAVNATATIAVLIPAVLYVLTLGRPAPRWRILAWWCPAVVAVTLWWSVPLVLLLHYGVSWLPYTESAGITTSVTSLSQILRGAENWVSYLVVYGQPWWQLGHRLVTGPVPILLSGLVAGLGLAGLTRPRLPGRRFLICLLLTGVVIIAAGHMSSLGNPFAGPVDQLINGPASPFRNLRKFDPLVRLPVALGLAHLLVNAHLPRLRAALAVAAGLAIAGLVLPAYTGGIALAGAFSQIPPYWVNAANWLNRHAGHQAVLVVPGAPFGQYLWGSPLDDVLQPLTSTDWAARAVSIIGSPGNERLLDAIDQRIAAGDGSAGLTELLARMGVRYVVVRNDLSRAMLARTRPAQVNQALVSSPGITKVSQSAQFVGTLAPDDAVTNVDPGYPAVIIYRVAGAQPVATVQPAAGTLRVYGGPESLLTLADEGLLGSRPVLLNSDSAGLPAASSVVTDSLRRRVRNFGELQRSYSPTLTAAQPARTYEAIDDYTEPGWSRYLSVAQYRGIRDVTASSSAADIGAIPSQWASGLLPYAAIDGDPRTMWESGGWSGPVGQWIRLRFVSPVDPGSIRVAFAGWPLAGAPVTQVAVRTAAGRVTDRVRVTGRPQVLRVPPGATGWLQLTVTGVASPPWFGAQAAIKEITVPGVRASRLIVAPAVHPAAATVVLAKAQPWPSGCMPTWLRWVCSPALTNPTEEQYGFGHAFTAGASGLTALHGSAVLISASLASKYLGTNRAGAWVQASSTYTNDPQDQARAAFDGDPATAWTASGIDTQPVLTIGWRRPLTVGRMTIQRPPGAVGPLQVLIAGSGGQVRGANVGLSGAVRFASMRTTRLTIRFTSPQSPLQISDVVIPRVPQLSTPPVPLRLRCGLGPALQVDGKAVPTRVSGTYADLLDQRPLHFAACSPVAIQAGRNQVTEPARDSYSVQDVVVGAPLPAVAAPAAPARIMTWTSSRRVVRVTASTRSYLVVNENFNPGWRAVIDGRPLRAVRLDGWKQAWLLPAGTAGVVTLTYPPNAIYRGAILAGLSALALALFVAAGPWGWARRRRTASPAGVAAPAPAAPSGGRPLHRPIVRVITGVVLASGLALAGLWLGGYPGAVLLPVAVGVFLGVSWGSRGRLADPRLVAGLMLAAAAADAVGEHLVLGGDNGTVALWLADGTPQIIGLLIIGRLAAELIRPGLDQVIAPACAGPASGAAGAGPGARSGSN